MRWSWCFLGVGFVVIVFFVTLAALLLVERLTRAWEEGR